MKHTMKQWSGITLMAILGGTLATGCTSDNLMENDGDKQPELITITAGLSKADTRMNFDEEGNVMKTLWEEGDQIVISSNSSDETKFKVFTIKEGEAGNATAIFEGEKPGVSELGGYYVVYYPASIKWGPDYNHFSYAGQEQDANNIKGHLKKFVSMARVLTDYSSFSFSGDEDEFECSSIMKFDLNLPTAVTPTKIILATNRADDNSGYLFKLDNNISMKTTKEVELTLTNYSAVTEFTAYLAMSKTTTSLAAGSTLTVTVVGTPTSYYKQIPISTNTELVGGKLHSITVSDGWVQK